MRILYLTDRFPVLSETFVINQVAGMVARGHDVAVYAIGGPAPRGAMHADVARHGLEARTFHGIPVPDAIGARLGSALRIVRGLDPRSRIRALSLFDPRRYGREAASLHAIHRGVGLLALPGGGRFDVVHSQFGNIALVALDWLGAGLIAGRLVTTFRGFDVSSFVRVRGERVYDELFRRGDAFLTNCGFFRDRLLALGCDGARLAVHPSGIDAGRFPFRARAPRADGVLRLVTVGRLVEKKGIAFALEAVARLGRRGVALRYDVVGEGPLAETLRARATELGVADRARFVGGLPHDRLVALLDEADLFVAANVTAADGDQDAPVNVLKEAMATGMPVVATRHGGIPELVEHGVSGLLVPERDPAALADAIARLHAAPQLWPEFGRAGRARVERDLDLEMLNGRLEAIYRRVLDGGPPA